MGGERLRRSTGRRAVIALVGTAAIAFAAVGAAADVAAHRIARDDALAETLRTADGVGRAVFGAELPAAVRGVAGANADLDAAVAARRSDGTLIRVKLWRRDGTVLWSDDAAVMGHRFPVDAAMLPVFDRQQKHARISTLTDADNGDERRQFADLVEVYLPYALDGLNLTMEMYFSDDRVLVAEHELGEQLVPAALLALLVLALAQLPVSIWLVRRTTAAQQDRDRMLDTVLVSSERERRLLAGHLHDGVVQELAGAAMLLEERLPAASGRAEDRRVLGVVAHVLRRSVGELRDLLVDLHPQQLTSDNLADVITRCAARTCPDLAVSVLADLDRPLPPGLSAFLYRCARECVTNVGKHAHAGRVDITLATDATCVRLLVRDDGAGIAESAIDRGDGHIGLSLLREAAADLGGTLQVRGDSGGTLVTVTVPLDAPQHAVPGSHPTVSDQGGVRR